MSDGEKVRIDHQHRSGRGPVPLAGGTLVISIQERAQREADLLTHWVATQPEDSTTDSLLNLAVGLDVLVWQLERLSDTEREELSAPDTLEELTRAVAWGHALNRSRTQCEYPW